MDYSIGQAIKLLIREVYRFRFLTLVIFVSISLSMLALGWYWPKEYTSSGTILVERQNIIEPLMEGTAVTTQVSDRAGIVKEIIFSRNVMMATLEFIGMLEDNPDDRLLDFRMEMLREKTQIENLGENLIRVSVSNNNPVTARDTTRFFIDQFLAKSAEEMQKESRAAFEFIDQQVINYHTKLTTSEDNLKVFRSNNLDATPGSEETVNQRILELQRRIEQTRLEIRESQISRQAMQAQLEGEVLINSDLNRRSEIQDRIATMQSQLDNLRLTYLDTYPDIIILRDQITALRTAAESQENSNQTEYSATEFNNIYNELRSQLSQTTTRLASLNARLSETESLLEGEKERARRINEVTAVLAELTRDYTVNQEIYQSLLRQRERARVSMFMDTQQQGMSLKLQEPPDTPVRPEGLRLIHFAMMGMILAFGVPIVFLYLILIFDNRVRLEQQFTSQFNVPLLANINHLETGFEQVKNFTWLTLYLFGIGAVIALYAYAGWLRYTL